MLKIMNLNNDILNVKIKNDDQDGFFFGGGGGC